MANAYATFAAQGEAAPWHDGATRSRAPTAARATRPKPKTDPRVRRGRDGRRELRAAAGGGERHRHRGAVARPARLRARPAPRRCGRTPRRRRGSSATRRSSAAAVDFYKGTGRADLDGVGGLPTFFGGEYPARIWTAFMTAAMQGKAVKDFPEPRRTSARPSTRSRPPTPSPTETPTETPTTETPTPTATDDGASRRPSVPTTPSPGESPPGTVVISPSLEPPDNGTQGDDGGDDGG